jgi:hypothetical protein
MVSDALHHLIDDGKACRILGLIMVEILLPVVL